MAINKPPKSDFKRESERIRERLRTMSEGQRRAAFSRDKLMEDIANKRGAIEQIKGFQWMDPAEKARIVEEEEKFIRERMIPQSRRAQDTFAVETAARRRSVAEQFSTDAASILREDVSRSAIHNFKNQQNIREQASLISRYGKSHVEERLVKEQEYHQRIQEDYAKQIATVSGRIESGKAPTSTQIQALRRREDEISEQRRRVAVLEQADVFARKSLPDYESLGRKMIDLGTTKYRPESGLPQLSRKALGQEREALERQQGGVVGEFLKNELRSKQIQTEIADLGTGKKDIKKKVALEDEFEKLSAESGKLVARFADLERSLEQNRKLMDATPMGKAASFITKWGPPAIDLVGGLTDAASDIGVARPKMQAQIKTSAAQFNAANLNKMIVAGRGDLGAMMTLSGDGLKDVLAQAQSVGAVAKGVGYTNAALTAAGGVVKGVGAGMVAGPAIGTMVGLADVSRAVGQAATAGLAGDQQRLQMTGLGMAQLEALAAAPMTVLGPALDYTRGMSRGGARMGGRSANALYNRTTRQGQNFINQAQSVGFDVLEAPGLTELGGRTMGAAFNAQTMIQAQRFQNARMGTREDYIAQRGILSGITSGDADILNKLANAVAKGTREGIGGARAVEALTQGAVALGGKAGLQYGGGSFESIATRLARGAENAADWRSVGQSRIVQENVNQSMTTGWGRSGVSVFGTGPGMGVVNKLLEAGAGGAIGSLESMDQEGRNALVRGLRQLEKSGGKMSAKQAAKLKDVPLLFNLTQTEKGGLDIGKLGGLADLIEEATVGGAMSGTELLTGGAGEIPSPADVTRYARWARKNPGATPEAAMKALGIGSLAKFKATQRQAQAIGGGGGAAAERGFGAFAEAQSGATMEGAKALGDQRTGQERAEALSTARMSTQILAAADKLAGAVTNAEKLSQIFLKITEDPNKLVDQMTKAMSDSLKGVVSEMSFPGTVNMTLTGTIVDKSGALSGSAAAASGPPQQRKQRVGLGHGDLSYLDFEEPQVKTTVPKNQKQGR